MMGCKKRGNSENIAYILLKFSLPLILSGILQQLYNWVDAFIIGNVDGEVALAAIGATSTVIHFYLMALTGFTLGLSILFAQRFGAGETTSIPKILATFSALLGAVFLLLSALGIGLASPILRLLHTTPDTIHLAEDYLRVIFLSVPALAVYNVYAAALRGIGDSRAPFLAIVVSSIVNVLLDILFVAGLRMGVSGAAAATVIAQVAMTIFLVAYSVKKHPLLRFSPSRASLDREVLAPGVSLGVPPMIQSSVSALGSLVLQNFMNGFGTQTVAAITTAYRIDLIVLLPIVNLGSGIATIVAQSYGAGEKKRPRQIFAVGTGIMTVVSLLMTALVLLAGEALIAMFGVGPEAVEIGRGYFYRIASFYLVFGLAMAVRGYLEGQGDVLYSSIAGIAALCSRIILSYALAGLWGNMVIAYAEAFSWVILLALYLIRVIWVTKRGKLQHSVN